MTTFQDTLIINMRIINAQANSAIDRTTKRLGMLQKKANLSTTLSKLGLSVNKSQGLIDSVTRKAVNNQEVMRRQIAETTKKMSVGMRQLRTNMLGFGLSMLFTGMAIKRLGDAIIKSLVKTYLTATDEQNKFAQQLLGVQASFEFLKFSIVDALSQSDLVIGFIDGLISMINWISLFISKHPGVAKFIGIFAALAVAIGGPLMVIGQTTLAIIGLIAGHELLLIVMGKLKALKFVKWLTSIKTATWLAFLPYLALLAAVIFLVVQFVKLKEETGSWATAFKAAGLGVLLVLSLIGDAINELMIAPLRLVIVIINALIAANNALALTKLGKAAGLVRLDPVRQPTFAPLTKSVLSKLEDLATEVAFEKALTKEREEDAARGGVTVIVNGDVSDAFLIDKITEAIDTRAEEIRNEIGVPVEVQ